MQSTSSGHNILWKYSDLAKYLQVSVDKLRRDVMNREIPFIKIGRSVRFDKNQIAEFFKIKINGTEKPPMDPISSKFHLVSTDEIATWLDEKSTLYPYAELGIRVIVHHRKIRRIERTIV